MEDRIVVYALGQRATVALPGSNGQEVLIDSVRIGRDGSVIYSVEWWDGGRRSAEVLEQDLNAEEKSMIILAQHAVSEG